MGEIEITSNRRKLLISGENKYLDYIRRTSTFIKFKQTIDNLMSSNQIELFPQKWCSELEGKHSVNEVRTLLMELNHKIVTDRFRELTLDTSNIDFDIIKVFNITPGREMLLISNLQRIEGIDFVVTANHITISSSTHKLGSIYGGNFHNTELNKTNIKTFIHEIKRVLDEL